MTLDEIYIEMYSTRRLARCGGIEATPMLLVYKKGNDGVVRLINRKILRHC